VLWRRLSAEAFGEGGPDDLFNPALRFRAKTTLSCDQSIWR
jgi:hypothetical protein